MVLNYDTTFLAIVLTGLYEPETLTEEKRCLLHPVHKHPMAKNDAIGYAADMCVLLAYQKGMDDWEDERRVSGRTAAALLGSAYKEIAARYPRQTKAVEENIRLLHEAEDGWKDGRTLDGLSDDIDYVAGLTGNFLGELYVWKDDIWQGDLRQIGFYLGKFIYLLDAVEDIEKDRKHGNYNVIEAVLRAKGRSESEDIWEEPYRSEIQKILAGMMTEASRAFERLPVLEYAPIIRNILYSGVWCKYTALRDKSEKKKKGRESAAQ